MNILTNFPYSPFTRKAGSGQRFLQNVLGLRDLGHQITIWSIEHESLYKWTDRDLEEAKKQGFIVKLTKSWELPDSFLEGIDLCWIVYYNLVDKYRKFEGPKICDNHDLLSCNDQINDLFKDHITKIGFKNTFRYHPEIFEVPKVVNFPISQTELDAYRECNSVVTISRFESERLAKHGIKTQYIPYFPAELLKEKPADVEKGKPGFCGSTNLNNLFANDLLGEIVLPKIRLKDNTFSMQVLGEIKDYGFKYPYIDYRGYRDDLGDSYRSFSFGLVPQYYGTGSRIKTLEMLSLGIPCVAFSCLTDDAPIIPGETGFSCAFIDEFVDSCIVLNKEVGLRRQMGINAREVMFHWYSEEQHKKDLEKVINAN